MNWGTPFQCVHVAPWTLTKAGLHIRNIFRNRNLKEKNNNNMPKKYN